jgi:Glycosyltransferase family 87
MFYVFSRPSRNEIGPEHDFVTIIAGAHCAIDRCDPYDSPTLAREFPKMGGYIPPLHFKPEWPVYPPSTLFVLLPLSLVPWPVLSVVWMLLSFGFLCAAFVVLLLRFKAYRDVPSFLPFGILLADVAIGQAVQLGQPTLIAGSALTLAIIALESGSMPVMGGLLLALSLCLKPQGAFLCGLYFLLRSRTRIPALAAYVFTAAAGLAGVLLFYFRLSSFAYLGHLSSNLKLALQPGRDADFSQLNEYSPSFLNLQAFLARLIANPHVCNAVTYAVCFVLTGLLVFICWRKKNLETRPYTILAALVMLELLVSYHRFYDHVFMLAALPGLYEIKQRSRSGYLLSCVALFVYLFRQFHNLRIHGVGPFPSGAPVELFIALLCLHSLWRNDFDRLQPHRRP